MKTINKYKIAAVIIAVSLTVQSVSAERIKDVTTIKGIRGNPLTGYGIVVGLNDTGDKSALSSRIIANILRRSNLAIDPSVLSTGSAAVVVVTAELGPFDTLGTKIDVSVSTLQDASSLQGGELLPTVLEGLDGQPYAVASGAIFLGGFTAGGSSATATKNHTTSGRIPGGANVEKEELATFIQEVGGENFFTLNLRNKDFSTAVNIQKSINEKFPSSAVAKNAGTVVVKLPAGMEEDKVSAFIDSVTVLETEVDMPAIVVVNEKTGTVVVGEHVGISACGVMQGSLIVKVKESAEVSQPQAPFSDAGETVVVPDTSLDITEEEVRLIPIEKVITVTELAKALNSIGATPKDMIAIFSMLKVQGALQAELIVQ
ncbi:MAG: flagellar basal body P-ring protein FlgI [Phycisphaerae bacterium]|nr:flagellar basal body P-ring protein FlgI [Phycisphaerae bacterium]